MFIWRMHLLPRITDAKTGNRNFQISSERVSRTGNRAVQNVGRAVCYKNFFCLLQNHFDKRRMNVRAIAGLSRQIRQSDVGVAVFFKLSLDFLKRFLRILTRCQATIKFCFGKARNDGFDSVCFISGRQAVDRKRRFTDKS